MINLFSKTGLGRSGHVRLPTFGQFSHASGPKTKFLTKFLDDSASFLLEKLKNMFFRSTTLIFYQKSQK